MIDEVPRRKNKWVGERDKLTKKRNDEHVSIFLRKRTSVANQKLNIKDNRVAELRLQRRSNQKILATNRYSKEGSLSKQ